MAGNQGIKLFTVEEAAASFGLDMIKYEDCARWAVSRLHPDGANCPHCSTPVSASAMERYRTLEQVRCSGCGRKFTAATGTLLCCSKLELREIYLIGVLLHLGVPTKRIAALLDVHPGTVGDWADHFQAQQERLSA
jgi:transposase-like protein